MTSPVDTSAKFYRDDFPGAPSLNGVAGALIGLLEACLCTGFGLRTATTLVVSGGVATVTLSSDAKNPNLLNSVITVAGVTGSLTALNGEQRVNFANTTELKFATAAADGTAAGTITVKTSPAGWEKKYPGTNTAGFKSLDPASFGAHLWVNDAGTINASVRAYENMTAVDTGTGPAPTVADSATGGYWMKSSAANATASRWDLFADSRAFYYCPVPNSGANPASIGQCGYFFGDEIPFKSGDVFAASISSAANAPTTSVGLGSVFYGGQGGATNAVCRYLRSYTGLGSAVAAFSVPYSGALISYSGADGQQGVFPAPTDGGLRVAKLLTTEGVASGSAAILRGERPGVFYSPQSGLYQYFQRGDIVTLSGRKLYVVYAGNSSGDTAASAANAGRGFVDITGPWR